MNCFKTRKFFIISMNNWIHRGLGSDEHFKVTMELRQYIPCSCFRFLQVRNKSEIYHLLVEFVSHSKMRKLYYLAYLKHHFHYKQGKSVMNWQGVELILTGLFIFNFSIQGYISCIIPTIFHFTISTVDL